MERRREGPHQHAFRLACVQAARGEFTEQVLRAPWPRAHWVPDELVRAAESYVWSGEPPVSLRTRVLLLSIAASGEHRLWSSAPVAAIADTLHVFSLATVWRRLAERPGERCRRASEAVRHWIERRESRASTRGASPPTVYASFYWPVLANGRAEHERDAWLGRLGEWTRPRGALAVLGLLDSLTEPPPQLGALVREAAQALCEPGGEAARRVLHDAFAKPGGEDFAAWAMRGRYLEGERAATLRALLRLAPPTAILGHEILLQSQPLSRELANSLLALPAVPRDDREAMRHTVCRLRDMVCVLDGGGHARAAWKAQVLFQAWTGGPLFANVLPKDGLERVMQSCVSFCGAWVNSDVVWPAWHTECARRRCAAHSDPVGAWDCLVTLPVPIGPRDSPMWRAVQPRGAGAPLGLGVGWQQTEWAWQCWGRMCLTTVQFPHLRAPFTLAHRRPPGFREARLEPLLRARQIRALVYATMVAELPFLPLDLTRVVADIVRCTRGRLEHEGVCRCCALKLRWLS